MNQELTIDYTAEEVYKVLMQMHPTKASDLDGMAPVFFQKFWHVVGDSGTTAVLSTLRLGDITPTLNHTHIVLISKKDNPTRVNDYRPISLDNVVYKLISKVIANRLKCVMTKVISETQCVFVLGRQITDCVIIAYELIHYLRNKREVSRGLCLLKLT